MGEAAERYEYADADGELRISPKIWPILEKRKRFKILWGGRGGGKTEGIGGGLTMQVDRLGLKVGCFREYQNQIEDSVHPLIKDIILTRNLPNWTVTDNQILHNLGGGFRFRGLARNLTGIKSMYGFDVFWYEEAQILSSDSIEVSAKTLRRPGSEHWYSLNPMSKADPISERFLEPYYDQLMTKGIYEDKEHLIIRVNWSDNPWFHLTPLAQDRISDFERLPRALYDHIWEGAYNDTIENAIILPEWFDAAVNAHERLGWKPRGVKVLAHDPADTGDDKALAIREGSVIQEAKAWKSNNVNDSCSMATTKAIHEYCDLFVWDGDGMGAGLAAQVADGLKGKKIQSRLFRGNDKVERPDEFYNASEGADRTKAWTNRQYFKNIRAQKYGELRDRFFRTWRAVEKGEYIDPDKQISINPAIRQLAQLKTELCRIPKKHNPNGVFQILSKPEMKKLGIKSPGLADCAMMSQCLPDKVAGGVGNLEFDSLWE